LGGFRSGIVVLFAGFLAVERFKSGIVVLFVGFLTVGQLEALYCCIFCKITAYRQF
jgi:hypothetical protein